MTPRDPVPYLSVVATARNDDHGGDLLRRMQLFVDGLYRQAELHRLECELVLVEWNPPADRPGLEQALAWRPGHPFLGVRVVRVSAALHARFRHHQRLPLFQMIAKNAGVRRSRGRFVLATNVDILFSDALFARLARRELERGVIYRADRHDVERSVMAVDDDRARLEACARRVVRINERFASRNLVSGEVLATFPRGGGGGTERDGLTPLHLNACGDFQLLSREDWFALGGYPELELYSLHIDSLFELNAHFAGRGEALLEEGVIYHIEHDSGWRPEAGGRRSFFANLRGRRLSSLPPEALSLFNRRVTATRRPWLLNNGAWGLGGQPLPEIAVTRAQWDTAAGGEVEAGGGRARKGLNRWASVRFGAAYRLLLLRRWLNRTGRRWRMRLGLRRGMSVAVLGAGELGEQLVMWLQGRGVEVALLLDNDPQRHGREVAGLPVRAVASLVGPGAPPVEAVVLATNAFESEMRAQLAGLAGLAGKWRVYGV